MSYTGKVLIVDDEKIALNNLEHIIRKEGYAVTACQSSLAALNLLDRESFDVVLSDLRMEKVDGMQILRKCRNTHPDFPAVIIITAFATLESAMECIKLGAFHYITKPYRLEEVRHVVAEAMARVQLKRETLGLLDRIVQHPGQVNLLTRDLAMQQVLELAQQVAPTHCNVLITGSSGTGKELLARYLHSFSNRPDGPFLAVNCGAIQEDLMSNELFGHEKGSFTGATSSKKGLVEAAAGGTLFLDEITEISPTMQVKLLRVMQEREVMRLGGTETIKVDVRFIAATNREIHDLVKEGGFRQDLYFRLNVVNLHLPPLRERTEDIPLLAYFFIRKYASSMKKQVKEISPEAMALLTAYAFPGNVRELENFIERGVALTHGSTIEVAHLPQTVQELESRSFRKKDGRIPSLEEQEQEYIGWVLGETRGNQTLAAQLLGIDRVSLWRKLKKYGIDAESFAI